LTSREPETILADSRHQADFDDSDPRVLANDFERVIFDMEPEIERARTALLKAGANQALLAGSGSSVFGIFDDLDAQVRAAETIVAEAGWHVFPCVTISRSEYSCAVGTGE
jgi:4-diphosphocytidyl-2-C-methyl-D-erythritol kinase